LVDDEDEEEEENEENDAPTPNENERPTAEWSDIPLNSNPMTESNSTTSSYSQTSRHEPDGNNAASGSNEKDTKDEDRKSSIGFSDWISNSSFRRQSLEDVFAQSNLFGKFGRLERRNSESEVETNSTSSSAKKEFFLFGGRPEGLTDSQIDNLFLSPEHL